MNDFDALMRTICEDPANDLPRLVAADYLDENGDPDRAEYIRLDCEAARLGNWKCECTSGHIDGCPKKGFDAAAVAARLKTLEEANIRNCRRWSQQFAKAVCGKDWLQRTVGWQWWFWRGFVDRVELTGNDWTLFGAKIVTIMPIQGVCLLGRTPEHVEDDKEPYFHWLNSTSDTYWDGREEYVPWVVHMYLPDGDLSNHRWLTEDSAHRALSIAAVRWARSRAGLRPLALEEFL